MFDSSRYAMIMAGGIGSRLWPMSRGDRPKQLMPIFGGRTLLEIAAERLEGVVAPENRYICTAEAHRATIRERMPEFDDEHLLGEPVGRDTVNAVALTAAVLLRNDPRAIFAVLTADHLIEPQDEFAHRLRTGFALIEDDSDRFVTFSIVPTFAATAFGWVERGNAIPGFDGAAVTRTFVEKPDEATARRFLEQDEFGWNSGMFVFPARRFLDAVEWFLPETAAGVLAIAEAWDTDARRATLEKIYPTLPRISVDHAVMVPASLDERVEVCTVPMDVSWIDIGSWPGFAETLTPDDAGNRANTDRVVHLDGRNLLVVTDDPDHVVATIGCEDLIIVRTAEATLVCRADQAQRVKGIVAKLEAKG